MKSLIFSLLILIVVASCRDTTLSNNNRKELPETVEIGEKYKIKIPKGINYNLSYDSNSDSLIGGIIFENIQTSFSYGSFLFSKIEYIYKSKEYRIIRSDTINNMLYLIYSDKLEDSDTTKEAITYLTGNLSEMMPGISGMNLIELLQVITFNISNEKEKKFVLELYNKHIYPADTLRK